MADLIISKSHEVIRAGQLMPASASRQWLVVENTLARLCVLGRHLETSTSSAPYRTQPSLDHVFITSGYRTNEDDVATVVCQQYDSMSSVTVYVYSMSPSVEFPNTQLLYFPVLQIREYLLNL